MMLSCTQSLRTGQFYLYRLRSPQHCRYHLIMLLHRISRQSGSFGKGRELRGLRVDTHIVPQLTLLLRQFCRRSDTSKLLLEIFSLLVHLRNQHFQLLLAFFTGVRVDVAGMLCSVRPYGRITPLKQVVIDLRDASGSRLSLLSHIRLKVHDAFLLWFRFFLRRCLAYASVDTGGGCAAYPW